MKCVTFCGCERVRACVRGLLLTEPFGSVQGLGSCVSHEETLDGNAALLHQLLALVLLQIQPSPGTQPGALEGKREQRDTGTLSAQGWRGGRMWCRRRGCSLTCYCSVIIESLMDLYCHSKAACSQCTGPVQSVSFTPDTLDGFGNSPNAQFRFSCCIHNKGMPRISLSSSRLATSYFSTSF